MVYDVYMEAAEQTKNFLSFNLFAFRRGVRGEPEKNGRKFLGLHARVRERVRGAFERNRSVLGGFKSPRTRSVRSQPLRGWKWVRAKVRMSAQNCRILEGQAFQRHVSRECQLHRVGQYVILPPMKAGSSRVLGRP